MTIRATPVDPATQKTWGPREGRQGPVHAAQPAPHQELSWCGARRQFRHMQRNEVGVTCKRCLSRLRLGAPLAYKGS